jgi:cell wall-associated NlpC family hydrolase
MHDQELLRAYLLSLLGTPYKYAGRNRLEGLDCSQLAIEIYVAARMLPHGIDMTAQDLYNRFGPFKNGAPQFLDLAFYGINTKNITHVGIVWSKDMMIEAGGGDSKTKELKDAIERSALVRPRPIKFRRDFLGCTSAPYQA